MDRKRNISKKTMIKFLKFIEENEKFKNNNIKEGIEETKNVKTPKGND